MIGNFQGIKNNLNLPLCVKNEGNYSKFISIFFTTPDFSFVDIDEFRTESVWLTAVENGYIIPIFDIKEVDDQSDETLYNKSGLDYTYTIYQGKYRFELRKNALIDYFQLLVGYRSQDLKVMFGDRNGNVYAKLRNDDRIVGFETTMLNDIKKIKIGQTANPSWTSLVIELDDPEEMESAVIENLGFNFNRLTVIPVTIQNISEGSMIFQVVDTVSSIPINVLNENNVTIVDDISGSITFSSFINNLNGYYEITSAQSFYSGTISIIGNYVGSQIYNFTSTIFVTITDITSDIDDEISFKVTETISGNPVTGLVTGDISIVDDINGAIANSVFSEDGSGYYSITGDDSFTSGTITVSNATYSGDDNYSFSIIPVTIKLTKYFRSENQVSIFVKNTSTSDPITTLKIANFELDDNSLGAVTPSSISNIGDGYYDIITSVTITDGDLNIVGVRFNGTKSYLYDGVAIEEDFSDKVSYGVTFFAPRLWGTYKSGVPSAVILTFESERYKMVCTNSSASGGISKNDILNIGNDYTAEIQVYSIVSGSVTIRNQYTGFDTTSNTTSFNSVGNKTFDFTADTKNFEIVIDGIGEFIIDNFRIIDN
jgi:hypothetical protein